MLSTAGSFIDIFLKMDEVKACHVKENNCQYLLPMIRFEHSSENQKLEKCVSATVNLIASQYVRDFFGKIGGDVNGCVF